jgi:hypothetical protein
MKLQEAFDTVKSFKKIIEKQIPELKFSIEYVPYKKVFRECWREDVPSPEHKFSSGVYLFCDEKDTVIYIGKATLGNLAHRMWDHLIPVTSDASDVPEFANNPWVTDNYKPDICEIIHKGDFTISAIIVKPKELSSLLEVYLQTLHFMREGKISALNNQIG